MLCQTAATFEDGCFFASNWWLTMCSWPAAAQSEMPVCYNKEASLQTLRAEAAVWSRGSLTVRSRFMACTASSPK